VHRICNVPSGDDMYYYRTHNTPNKVQKYLTIRDSEIPPRPLHQHIHNKTNKTKIDVLYAHNVHLQNVILHLKTNIDKIINAKRITNVMIDVPKLYVLVETMEQSVEYSKIKISQIRHQMIMTEYVSSDYYAKKLRFMVASRPTMQITTESACERKIDEFDCCICLTTVKPEFSVSLGCNHKDYCRNCIFELCKITSTYECPTCPMCRAVVTTISV